MKLGFAHPDELLGRLTSTQISEWRAYDRIEPINRGEIGWAMLCSVVSNIAISLYGKEGKRYTKPEDFLSMYGHVTKVAKKEQTVEEQKRLLLLIAGIQNKKEGRKDG